MPDHVHLGLNGTSGESGKSGVEDEAANPLPSAVLGAAVIGLGLYLFTHTRDARSLEDSRFILPAVMVLVGSISCLLSLMLGLRVLARRTLLAILAIGVTLVTCYFLVVFGLLKLSLGILAWKVGVCSDPRCFGA